MLLRYGREEQREIAKKESDRSAQGSFPVSRVAVDPG